MRVVRQGERGVAYDHLISNCAIEPLSGEDLLEDWVEFLAIRAEIVLKELNLDANVVGTLSPSWIGAEDWCAVGRCNGGHSGRSNHSVH